MIKCPFCGNELNPADDNPTIVKTAVNTQYVCHKVICKNVNGHPDHNNITVVFNPKEEKTV